MTTKTSGTRSTLSDLRTLFQGVVSTSSTAVETDAPTRSSKNRAAISPVRVMTQPQRQVRQRRTWNEEERRKGHDAGEEGHEQPDTLDEESERHC